MPVNDDPVALLVELRRLKELTQKPEPEAQRDDDQIQDELAQMLADLDRNSSSIHTKAVEEHCDDPRQMLAELASLSTLGFPAVTSPADSADEEDDDLHLLYARLEKLRQPFDDNASFISASTAFDKTETDTPALSDLDQEVVPYLVALILEDSNYRWEHAQAWTAHIFSSNFSQDASQAKQEIAVLRAETKLESIITSVLGAEQAARQLSQQTQLKRRLIVSNLAAAADKKEIERQFWAYRWDMYVLSPFSHHSVLVIQGSLSLKCRADKDTASR